jgi:hypothetical protein
MFPPVNTHTANIPQLNNSTTIDLASLTSSNADETSANQKSKSNWKNQAPVNSPDLKSTPKLQIAQSELPGSSPQAPPSPSIRDTGNGYPARIPANYFGPAIGFGNNNGTSSGSSFGVVSRFPFSTNYSIRPSAIFGSAGTILRVPVTYDFILGEKEPFERNPIVTFNAGGGVQFSSSGGTARGDKFGLLGTIGVDVNLFEGIALVGSYNTDFNNISGGLVGLGFEF